MRTHKHIILQRPISITAFIVLFMVTSCNPNKNNKEFSGADGEVQIMTLNPGHFHAALIQKDRINQVDPEVHVYAPEGPDLDLHLARIEGFNSQNESSAKWDVNVRTSPEYMRLMLDERPGNVVITAGNNRKKTEYIKRSVDSGLNVLSDKPMAIDKEGWELLVSAFESANKNDVLLYDIMTERYNVISILQQRLAQNRDLFGELEEGSIENPAIIKEAVHHLYKQVSGEPLRRPPWYFDVEQQGEGIVDVSTHLIDLAMWGSFPGKIIDYKTDVQMLQANRWATEISEDQFEKITGMNKFLGYLQDQLVDGLLPLYSNGDIFFTLN
ncbi:MAG: putative oxidoreductase C-terminal domain-containing protein, partial [Balneolales bacterium]